MHIECTLNYPGCVPKNTFIEDVCQPFSGENYPLRVIIEGKSYSPELVSVNDIVLTERDHLKEWYQCILKQRESGKTEYKYEERGYEYYYSEHDFRRHYTDTEG